MSLTIDRNSPCLKEGQRETGQNDCYLVLSEEERAKGFVRPVRQSYVHIGKDVKSHWKKVYRMLNEEEKREFSGKDYVAVMTVLEKEDGSFLGGAYVTQEELEAWEHGKRTGGCGTSTRMGLALAETYARDPKFYSSTFCVECNKHLPVSEFVWEGTNEIVGS